MSLTKRNYSITGPEGEQARARGLVEAEWYTCDVPRQAMKQLMVRRNGPALRDTLIWFASLGVLGYLLYLSWGTWWLIPALFAYGVVYTVPAVSKWHEFSHGTPFKTSWLNEAMYQVTAFMIVIPATLFRWSHVRHHSDTIIVGRDLEIFSEKPPNWNNILISFVRFPGFFYLSKDMLRHAWNRLTDVEKAFIPASACKKLFWEARIWVIVYLGLLVWCISAQTILPLLFVGAVPTTFGAFLNYMLIITQHGGLIEDVLDHRLNTRTFYTNPVLQFLYSNMNYHLEHHMFPMVPYYNLPKLHALIKHDCPLAYPSLWSALVEGMKAIYRQRKEPAYLPERTLPASARPFKYAPNT